MCAGTICQIFITVTREPRHFVPSVMSACYRYLPREPGMGGPAQSFAEEFFYAWQFERPASPWLFAMSALLVVVVMALCLFPLAPHWCFHR